MTAQCNDLMTPQANDAKSQLPVVNCQLPAVSPHAPCPMLHAKWLGPTTDLNDYVFTVYVVFIFDLDKRLLR